METKEIKEKVDAKRERQSALTKNKELIARFNKFTDEGLTGVEFRSKFPELSTEDFAFFGAFMLNLRKAQRGEEEKVMSPDESTDSSEELASTAPIE